MVLKGEIISTIEGNIKDRVDNVRSAAHNQVEIVKGSIDELTNLKPVVAVVDLINKTGANLGGIVKTQAEITRRHVK